MGNVMFENLEIRRVSNGFILVINTEDDTKEFVYDTERKLLRAVKGYLGEKVAAEWLPDEVILIVFDYCI